MPTAYVIRVRRTPQGPILSEVIVTYEGEYGIGEPGTGIFSDPEIELTDITQNVPTDVDIYDNPIVNACGEPLNGVQREISDQVLNVTRNFTYWNSYVQGAYRQAVNSDWFFGWPPGTAKIDGLNAKLIQRDPAEGGLGYWQVNARIRFRYPYRTIPAKAWYARIRHEGYYELDSDVEVTITDEDGSGALAVASVVKGKIVGIAVVNGGTGYVNPPSVVITSTGGSGAAATAFISNGSVTSIRVDNPGSGYNARKIPIVDGNKQPVKRPALLDRFGKHSGGVCWLEIPMHVQLPFNALGLL
ncbi:hypothetical protein SH467x_000585 [Pirellulaceae bacterium SH467]